MTSPKKPSSPLPDQADELAALLHELRLHDDASELRHFAELCRGSLRIRTWLFGRFAKEPETQAKFRAFLRDPDILPDGLWSPVLEREVASRPPPVPATDGPFGGLSEPAVWALIKQYQAGRINILTFLLVRVWRQLQAAGRTPPPALWRATLDHWAALVADGGGRRLNDLKLAVGFFDDRPGEPPDCAGVESDSWKIHLLLQILDHPQPCYRVSELYASLPEKFRRMRHNGNPFVDLREVRRFCEKHGIRRDQRAGRPPSSRS
jgi:hypothetical protein